MTCKQWQGVAANAGMKTFPRGLGELRYLEGLQVIVGGGPCTPSYAVYHKTFIRHQASSMLLALLQFTLIHSNVSTTSGQACARDGPRCWTLTACCQPPPHVHSPRAAFLQADGCPLVFPYSNLYAKDPLLLVALHDRERLSVDLSDCGLHEVPKDLLQQTQLTSLNIAKNSIQVSAAVLLQR